MWDQSCNDDRHAALVICFTGASSQFDQVTLKEQTHLGSLTVGFNHHDKAIENTSAKSTASCQPV